MEFHFARGRWCALLAALALAAGACDDEISLSGDAGTDTDTDADTDTDVDTDADAGPDGGELDCDVDAERVFDDVAFFASEELGGRETGTEGNEAAMAAAEALFEELGLVPMGDEGTYRQAFGYQKSDFLEVPSVALDGEPLDGCTDFSFFYGSGNREVTEELVYVGYGMTVPAYDTADYPDCPLPSTGYDDYEGVDVTGKIAVVVRHGPGDDDSVPDECPDNDLCGADPCLWNFTYKAANADLHGAAAMIVVQNYDNGPEILAGASVSDGYIADLASVWVDRDVMEASLPDLQTWTDAIDADLAPESHATGVTATISVSMGERDVATANLVGAIPGTDPEIGGEVVVVGGHIDHLGNDVCLYAGADDNASGAAVTMELARLVTECANPARTIVFALWNGEEDGLLGSAHYVDNPAYPLASTVAAFSADMVGAGESTNIVMYGAADGIDYYGNPLEGFPWMADLMQASAEEMGFDWPVVDGEQISASDHWPFAAMGVPGVCIMTGPLESHPYYHTYMDDIDGIGVDHLRTAASMLYAGVKPLVEGTEAEYLDSGKSSPEDGAPLQVDPDSRLYRDR